MAAGNDVPSLSGAALRCRGLAEGDPRILRSAVDAYTRSARPLELALAAEDAGAGFARQADADATRRRQEAGPQGRSAASWRMSRPCSHATLDEKDRYRTLCEGGQ